MSEDIKYLDFHKLEFELQSAIDTDARYWRENEAKIRAVNQVTSYEEFRKIVKACHLKPLKREDIISCCAPGKIWNKIANKGENSQEVNRMDSVAASKIKSTPFVPVTAVEFRRLWQQLSTHDRLSLLRITEATTWKQLFMIEIPSNLLGEILEILTSCLSNSSDVLFTIQLLESLAEVNRFTLSMQFLSYEEKSNSRYVIEGLKKYVCENKDDVSLSSITQERLLQIEKIYSLI